VDANGVGLDAEWAAVFDREVFLSSERGDPCRTVSEKAPRSPVGQGRHQGGEGAGDLQRHDPRPQDALSAGPTPEPQYPWRTESPPARVVERELQGLYQL
jgi:hypothetical protein